MRAFLFILLTACFGRAFGDEAQSKLEEGYLKERNADIKQFAASTRPQDKLDSEALAKLEKKLQQIIGPVQIAGFSGPGKINLETLQQDGGFDQIDGLKFTTDHEQLFVTTFSLLKSYFSTHEKLAKDFASLPDSNEFYSKVLSWDSAFTIFTSIPVRKVRIYTTLNAQDNGAFAPNNLIAYAEMNQRVFVLKSDLVDLDLQIAICENTWKKRDEKKTSPAQLQEQKNFEDYQKCWKQYAKSEKFFKKLESRANSLAERLSPK